jgi:membrane AbrB-like protein
MSTSMKRPSSPLLPILTALALSVGGGFIFRLLHVPLPWMLGPMFAVGVGGVAGVKVGAIRGGRQAGQLVIGCALGLYFSADVTRQLFDYGGYIVGAAFTAILIGAFGSVLLKRLSGMDAVTAFFASVPGGASEMAVLAERAGARFDQVALAHSLRVLITVSFIPIAVTLSGASGSEIFVRATTHTDPRGLALLIALAGAAGYVVMRARVPNAWLLGPLLVSLLLTVSNHSFSAIPQPMSNTAQLLIGCSLGARFQPRLRSESRQLMIGIIASASLTTGLSLVMGLLIAALSGESVATMVLATAPGGLSEMCITAKILRLGVPLVTSFQVARLAIVVTCSLPVWRLMQAIHARRWRQRS